MNVNAIIRSLSVDNLAELKKIVDKELIERYRKMPQSISVDELDISIRAIRCLRYNNIKTLNELTCIKPSELKGIGNKSIMELTECLTARGMKWGS